MIIHIDKNLEQQRVEELAVKYEAVYYKSAEQICADYFLKDEINSR